MKSSKQITAVEWFEQQLDNLDIEIPFGIFEQAKELEKQQTIDSMIERTKEYAETKDIQQLIDHNYQAQVKRKKDLTRKGCFLQILEEDKEFVEAVMFKDFKEEFDELADKILTCFTYAKSCNINIMQVLSDKVAYNEKRLD